MKKEVTIEITKPINQLNLYGYNTYFDLFTKLFDQVKVPNVILLSGAKGLGKSTFVYHFINYIFTQNENEKYDLVQHKISQNNRSYNLVNKSIHPNFFTLTTNPEKKEIKVDETRALLNFLNKSTYSLESKYVLIDSADKLNLNSSNSILKILEEPPKNAFFFIINDSKKKILPTIKSRSHEFKFYFTLVEKENIFRKIVSNYNIDINVKNTINNFHFDSPGNLLKYSLILSNSNIDINENIYDSIFHFIDLYKKNKDEELLIFASLFVEVFYNQLYLKSDKNLNNYFFNKEKISNYFNNMKKYNLNESSIFYNIKDILKNEVR
jgi:DNA polymerase-3 subunit delta'